MRSGVGRLGRRRTNRLWIGRGLGPLEGGWGAVVRAFFCMCVCVFVNVKDGSGSGLCSEIQNGAKLS